MAYTDIPTVSVGDLYTAANFNTHLRDNFAAGIPDAFTAKGDIAFGAGADTIGRLALGTAGQWLACDSAETLGVKWATPTSFFDWFTFGSYTTAAWTNRVLNAGGDTLLYLPDLGIPSTAGLFLASLSVLRNTDGFLAWGVEDHVHIASPNDTALFIITYALGDSTDTGTWAWNTQAGLVMVDSSDSGLCAVKWPINKGFTATFKIWGYA